MKLIKMEVWINKQKEMGFKSALDDVKKEIAIMKKLNHENVVKLYEVIENPLNDKIYLGSLIYI